MRILFLIGSLTVGAALACGLFQFGVVARFAFGVAAIAGVTYIFRMSKGAHAGSQRVAYVVDKEAERYSESDVAEFLRALSEAKAKSAAPFASESNPPGYHSNRN